MSNTAKAFIEGAKIFLRAFEPSDAAMVARIENLSENRNSLFYAFPTNAQQQLEKTEKQLHDPNSVVFTVCHNETGEAIGQTAFFRIDWVGRMAIFYVAIADKENRAKGYGSEIMKLMLEYAFNTLNLNRIQLHVAAENKAAIELYEKSGFVNEGTLRQAMFNNGKYSDFYVMGVLRSDRENNK